MANLNDPQGQRVEISPKRDLYDRVEVAKKFLGGALAELSKELATQCCSDQLNDRTALNLAGACEKIADAIGRIDPSSAAAGAAYIHEGRFP